MDSSTAHLIDKFVGQRLRETRRKLNLKLSDLATHLNVSHQQIQKYEQGQTRISASVLFQLAQIMGVTPNYFFEGAKMTKDMTSPLIETSDIISPDRISHLNILIVEDDPADQLLLRKAIEDTGYETEIYTIHDGMAALDFLRDKRGVNPFPRPDLILMDLHLPKRNGHSLLKEIKRDRDLQDLPVVVISNNVSISEMTNLYRNYAAGFICKSFDYKLFKQHIKTMISYWTEVVVLPNTAK